MGSFYFFFLQSLHKTYLLYLRKIDPSSTSKQNYFNNHDIEHHRAIKFVTKYTQIYSKGIY
uniref:Uncharacterized protein n=1 Tax=Cannabis sativa TaxID=3483 RepID=A0A803R556_CANSA